MIYNEINKEINNKIKRYHQLLYTYNRELINSKKIYYCNHKNMNSYYIENSFCFKYYDIIHELYLFKYLNDYKQTILYCKKYIIDKLNIPIDIFDIICSYINISHLKLCNYKNKILLYQDKISFISQYMKWLDTYKMIKY